MEFYKTTEKLSDIVQPSQVVYVPENAEDNDDVFSKQDFLDLCKGDKYIAQIVLDLCEWQSPYTVIDELIREEEFEENQFNLF